MSVSAVLNTYHFKVITLNQNIPAVPLVPWPLQSLVQDLFISAVSVQEKKSKEENKEETFSNEDFRRATREQLKLEKFIIWSGKAKLEKVNFNNKIFHIISVHQHDNPQAVKLFMDEVIPKLLGKDPNKFLFLVEMNSVEAQVVRTFARNKTVDPIVHPFNEVTAELAGIPKEEAAMSVYWQVGLEILEKIDDPELREQRALAMLQEIPRYFNITFDDFLALLKKDIEAIDKDKEEFKVVLKKYDENIKKLQQVSNDLSYVNLKMILEKNPQAEEIIVLIGDGHRQIFNENYKLQHEYSSEKLKEIIEKINSLIKAAGA